MAERLGVRVQRPRPVAGDAVELGRGRLVAGEREVVRDHRRVQLAPPARAERGRDAAVEEPPPRERHPFLDEDPLLLVAEVERPLVGLDEHAARDQLLERDDDLLVAAAARVAHRVGVERPPEHRGGGDDLPGELAERAEARREQLADAAGHRPFGRVRVLAGERVEVLDDEERQAAALAVEARSELGVVAARDDELGDVGGA